GSIANHSLGSTPELPNLLQNKLEIRFRREANGSISVQERQPTHRPVPCALGRTRRGFRGVLPIFALRTGSARPPRRGRPPPRRPPPRRRSPRRRRRQATVRRAPSAPG